MQKVLVATPGVSRAAVNLVTETVAVELAAGRPSLGLFLPRSIAAALPGIGRHFVEVGLGLQEELEEAMGNNGIILHPPYNRPAPPHWDAFRTPFAPAYTAIFNVMEFPVTQVPAGFSQEGLPLGVQVVGARGMDHLTIAAARIIEAAMGGWTMADPT